MKKNVRKINHAVIGFLAGAIPPILLEMGMTFMKGEAKMWLTALWFITLPFTVIYTATHMLFFSYKEPGLILLAGIILLNALVYGSVGYILNFDFRKLIYLKKKGHNKL